MLGAAAGPRMLCPLAIIIQPLNPGDDVSDVVVANLAYVPRQQQNAALFAFYYPSGA